MPDNGISIVFVFVEKVVRSRESYLIYVLIYFFSRHTYAAITDSKSAILLIN